METRAAVEAPAITGPTPVVSMSPYWPLTEITGRKVP